MSSIQYIPNQPVTMYKLSPIEEDLIDGSTAWDQTAYHKRLGNCGFIGPDYCAPAEFTDPITFQFKLATTGTDKVQPNIYCTPQSTNDSTGTNLLIDSTATFLTNPFFASNQWIKNMTTAEGAYIVSVDSETQLTLSRDIFTTTGHNYVVCTPLLTGDCYSTAFNAFVSTGPSSLTYDSFLIVDDYYQVTLTVTDITAGSFDVYLGSNAIGAIDSVGTHTLYGKCESQPNLTIIGNFSGSLYMLSITAYKLVMDYTLAVFDLDGNYISSLVLNMEAPEAFNSWRIGNGCFTVDWGNLVSECGNYVLGLCEGAIEVCTQLITNGTFVEGSTGWTLGENIFIDAGHAIFMNNAKGALTNELTCPIQSGHSYTFSMIISPYGGVQQGIYGILVNGVQISPSYNAALQSGTITFDFTAASDATQISIQYISGVAMTFTLDNVSLICNDCGLSIDDADGMSECYCVCETQDCTKKLVYSNNLDAYGIYYAGGFVNHFRIDAGIQSINISNDELTIFKNTLHSMSIPYFNGKKIEELATDLLPNWVHDVISVAIKHDLLYIDGIWYIGLEEHSPVIESTEVFGAKTKIAKVNQKYLNKLY